MKSIAIEGLNITGFAGKWKVAQEMASSPREYTDFRHLLPYWERARLFFLELGGEYTSQKSGSPEPLS